ncbi:adenylate/guanylate cyclase domain-containing protein [Pseudoxanthobacter sp.]|uniref:adenylate/guanylate cyclase domain-containing protein n=1 Tax=Pseudoxanthobacter sp. TaxID=1925742 RepID=UPI002FE1DCEF
MSDPVVPPVAAAAPVPPAGGVDDLVHARILASMRDGVLSIDMAGRILTFNAAAGGLLGLDPAATVGASFAEAFLLEERLEDFNEVVLKAVYENETVHARDLMIAVGGRNVYLHVSSSFLLAERDGAVERHGVIVVMSDITEQRRRKKITRIFGEYLDPRVVERILARSPLSEERGRRQVMTVSFTDLRDFSGWTERLEPEALVDLLNSYLAAMTKAIGTHSGLTDKFIGDAVMAWWGPPFTDPATQARDACETALDQIAALPALQKALQGISAAAGRTLAVAIGIATGEVVAGDVGADTSRNFTVIGNAVNTAARLEGAAKLYGVPVLVSDATRRAAGDGLVFREVDRVILRGQTRPEAVHALMGRSGSVSAGTLHAAVLYENALMAYRDRDFAAARRMAGDTLDAEPHDAAARLLLRRAGYYSENPPAEDWCGVWDGPA